MIAHGPIRALSYLEDDATLFATFESGRHYTFFGICPRTYLALIDPSTRDRTMADRAMWAFRWIETWPFYASSR